MSQISEDVGLWQEVDGAPQLRPEGRQFIEEAFGG
jgi:hypothetical protein